MELTLVNLIVILASAVVLGGIVGLERNLAGKTAGMRTYAMVALGSALFVLIGRLISDTYVGSSIDPLRIASQIIVGVGFIGAGLVILQGNKVTGITTAAGLWVAAGVGMACGFGLFQLAIIVTILSLIVFTLLWFIEKKLSILSYGKIDEE